MRLFYSLQMRRSKNISERLRNSMETGKKFDEGKLRYDLVPSAAFEEVVRAWTIGSKKYGDRNWENGLSYGRTFAALMRHAWAWWRGESHAPDDGQHHLAAV